MFDFDFYSSEGNFFYLKLYICDWNSLHSNLTATHLHHYNQIILKRYQELLYGGVAFGCMLSTLLTIHIALSSVPLNDNFGMCLLV